MLNVLWIAPVAVLILYVVFLRDESRRFHNQKPKPSRRFAFWESGDEQYLR